MLTTVLFDLDGTLTDPKPGITRCIRHALTSLGVESPPLDELAWCIGPPLRGSLAKLVGEERVEGALRLYRERFVEVGLYENTPYPGVGDALAELAGRGLALHVATSKPWVYAEPILERFELRRWFGEVFGAELDGTRADKAELLAFALARLGRRPDECLMVGDRSHDIRGATANGMGAVGVLYGYGSRDELVASSAAALAASPSELVACIEAGYSSGNL